ncbi:MAG: hypothetical protein IJL47_05705 [Lachnospiraceae bacterium]|nr:hypothetical protein [Lachnospiraceae bacterium]MBQ6197032.1 hypothetical protein [Lachnospiraceae bacterium]
MSMLCYQCGNTLGAGKYCLRCGADVQMYRKIARLANRYYNEGLARASVRDLSGAVAALKQCLAIDKRNIPARNLLGLVLYERGETIDALAEWVVSTNYLPHDNLAESYVEALQKDRTEMDLASNAIHKFNLALEQAKAGSNDLALIQLQYVTEKVPRMVKAHELMALLLLDEGDNAKAKKEIDAALKIDCGSVFCRHLLQELDNAPRQDAAKNLSRVNAAMKNTAENVKEKAGRVGGALQGRAGKWLRFLLGLILLVCAIEGILVPTISRNRETAVNQAVASYAEQMESLRLRLAASEDKNEAYEILLQMSELDIDQDRDKIEELFLQLSITSADSDLYKSLYDSWRLILAQRSGQ